MSGTVHRAVSSGRDVSSLSFSPRVAPRAHLPLRELLVLYIQLRFFAAHTCCQNVVDLRRPRAVADVCDRMPSVTASVGGALWLDSAFGPVHSSRIAN